MDFLLSKPFILRTKSSTCSTAHDYTARGANMMWTTKIFFTSLHRIFAPWKLKFIHI